MVSVTGSGGKNFLSLTLLTLGELMPFSCHRTPLLLQEAYAALKKSIQDSLLETDEFLQNPGHLDAKPRYDFGRCLRGKFKEWIDEVQGIHLEMEDDLDWDLAETENEGERNRKVGR